MDEIRARLGDPSLVLVDTRATERWRGDTEPLERLSASCRSAAVRAGVEVDGSKFRPHLTLARANRPLELTRWLRVFDLYAGPSWQVEEIALVQSQLGQGRPKYQLHETFALGVGAREEAG